MKIFFLHNPKAGGMSLRTLLSTPFSKDSIAPVFDNSPYDHRNKINYESHINGFKFYAGHFGFDVYKSLSRKHQLITNFRDPIHRIKSLYRYWREFDLSSINKESAGPVTLAKDLTFSNFIRHPDQDLRLYIDNFHFRQLLSSGWEPSNSNIFSRSIVRHRISRMPWIFICEMPELSLILLGNLFPDYAGVSIKRENMSRSENFSITPEDARFIASKNTLDYEIYSYALALQIKRASRLCCITSDSHKFLIT